MITKVGNAPRNIKKTLHLQMCEFKREQRSYLTIHKIRKRDNNDIVAEETHHNNRFTRFCFQTLLFLHCKKILKTF